jgi:hypothetical protein
VNGLKEHVISDYQRIFGAYTNGNDGTLFCKKNVLAVQLVSDKTSPADLMPVSRMFMNHVLKSYYQQDQTRVGNKIKIYKLGIHYNVKKEKQSNPEYTRWLDKFGEQELEMEKQHATNDGDEDGDGEKKKSNNKNKDFLLENYHSRLIYKRPQEFIEVDILVPEARADFIKSDSKPLKYLYLQEKFQKMLNSYLTNFKTGKKRYEKFGITYKGGITLSGDPGCGKSSTIVAIGTFLNKDIYYIDLGTLKTNNELKLLMDYIRTNSQNGAVIIFEDIDCMTDIVRKRKHGGDLNEPTMTNAMSELKNDKLNLSFLLNVLDGTMAPEDVIFIMTTNHPELLDSALVREGRMDINVKLNKCDRYQVANIYRDLYEKELDQSILNRFKEDTFIVAKVILHLFHNIYNTGLTQEELLSKFCEPIEKV